MKKILAMLTVFALILSAAALADTFEPAPELSGIISGFVDDGFMLTTENGSEHIVTTTNTVLDIDDTLNIGDYVTVVCDRTKYNVISAEAVLCHVLAGSVTDISGLNADEPYILMTPDVENAPVQVNLDGFDPALFAEGAPITVFYNGQMSRSFPAQISAQYIRSLCLLGTVGDINEDGSFFLTVQNGETAEEVIILVNDATQYFAELTSGEVIRVAVGPAMTLSLPAQYNALEILPGAVMTNG